MDPISLAAFGIGLASSVAGAAFGFDQADQQRAQTREQLRRFTLAANRTKSLAAAQAGASGIEGDSASLTKYMADMSAEFSRQSDWMQQAGDRQASATEFSSIFHGLSNFGSSVFGFGQANNWFKTPAIK